jgi:hypothetical protein
MTYPRPLAIALILACFIARANAQTETPPASSEAVDETTDAPAPGEAPTGPEAPPPAETPAEVVAPETEVEPIPEAPPPEPEFQGFSDTELQALFMFGPQRLNDDAAAGAPILTFQHFSTFRWGSNFFFLDVEGQGANPNWHFWDEKFGLYFEYAPTLSLTKLGLFTLPEGIILRDLAPTVQLNLGYTPGGFEINQVWLGGLAVNWNLPGLAVFETQFLARKENQYGTTWQVTIAWLAPFSIGPVPLEFRGFFDIWQTSADSDEPGTEDKLVVLTQPQIVVQVGPVYLGAEFDIRHDFPRKDFYTSQDMSNTWDIRLGPMAMFNF